MTYLNAKPGELFGTFYGTGSVIYIIGHVSTGKTTTAVELSKKLTKKLGVDFVHLDMDTFKKQMGKLPGDGSYHPDERLLWYDALANRAVELAREGKHVVVSATLGDPEMVRAINEFVDKGGYSKVYQLASEFYEELVKAKIRQFNGEDTLWGRQNQSVYEFFAGLTPQPNQDHPLMMHVPYYKAPEGTERISTTIGVNLEWLVANNNLKVTTESIEILMADRRMLGQLPILIGAVNETQKYFADWFSKTGPRSENRLSIGARKKFTTLNQMVKRTKIQSVSKIERLVNGSLYAAGYEFPNEWYSD